MHRINMTLKKSEDAISPVIGVMLMLVVTIVIAAVVVAVSTGMVTETKTAPNAVFEVTIDRNVVALEGFTYVAGPDLTITHISGDSVHSGEIEIFFSWVDQFGDLHESSYSAKKFSELCPDGMTDLPDAWGSTIQPRLQPLYQKTTDTGGSGHNNLDHYFGEVVFTPGVKFCTTPDFLLASMSNYANTGSPFMDAILNNGKWTSDMNYEDEPYYSEDAVYVNNDPYVYAGGIMDYLPVETKVDVKIVHIPSNKVIFNKDIYVTETVTTGTEWYNV